MSRNSMLIVVAVWDCTRETCLRDLKNLRIPFAHTITDIFHDNADKDLMSSLTKLVVRKATIDVRGYTIATISLLVVLFNSLWSFTHDKYFITYEPAIMGVYTLMIIFFQVLVAADGNRAAKLHNVEEYRPYLVPHIEGDQILIENIGRGIAFSVTLYIGASSKTIREIGIIRSGGKTPISADISKMISDQGIEIFYMCQVGRWWGSSIAPAVSSFAVEFMEFKQDDSEKRVF